MRKRNIKKLVRIPIVLAGILILALIAALLAYPPVYVFRLLAWGNSDSFDWQKFPNHPLEASPAPIIFNEAPDDRVALLFSQLDKVSDSRQYCVRLSTLLPK